MLIYLQGLCQNVTAYQYFCLLKGFLSVSTSVYFECILINSTIDPASKYEFIT